MAAGQSEPENTTINQTSSKENVLQAVSSHEKAISEYLIMLSREIWDYYLQHHVKPFVGPSFQWFTYTSGEGYCRYPAPLGVTYFRNLCFCFSNDICDKLQIIKRESVIFPFFSPLCKCKLLCIGLFAI